MTNKRAIIFGNGYSRKNIIWNDDHDVWACNLAFEEAWPIDVLVSTDANRQHQIYTSGYAEHHRCIFLDWNPAPPEMTPQMMEDLGYHTISNEPETQNRGIPYIGGEGCIPNLSAIPTDDSGPKHDFGIPVGEQGQT